MDHLDVVAGTSLSNPVTAGNTVHLSSGGLENGLDGIPGCRTAAGHEGGAIPCTLLTTRHTGANKQETLFLELLGAADRIGVVRVTTIDDDVALLEMGGKLADEAVDRGASLDEEDDFAGSFELGNQFLDRVGTDYVGACDSRFKKIELNKQAEKSENSKTADLWLRFQGSCQLWKLYDCRHKRRSLYRSCSGLDFDPVACDQRRSR